MATLVQQLRHLIVAMTLWVSLAHALPLSDQQMDDTGLVHSERDAPSNALGDILLNKLRFRDLSSESAPIGLMYYLEKHYPYLSNSGLSAANKITGKGNPRIFKRNGRQMVTKRRFTNSLTMSSLADLLSSMRHHKAIHRGIDQARLYLQPNLRFG
ncbi:unnamed protein product [Owenia fusiformis]|uniref:Uncharacterized protein n=1 Tax=Owenia fusiformis TaxID=6347 RepID=A0A8J1XUL8_OWEFU|nr:unnamed protein product [Owenia fusiformis]